MKSNPVAITLPKFTINPVITLTILKSSKMQTALLFLENIIDFFFCYSWEKDKI